MYIDENPTICGDENCTITRLPTSLCLCNEDLDKLLDLLKDEEEGVKYGLYNFIINNIISNKWIKYYKIII